MTLPIPFKTTGDILRVYNGENEQGALSWADVDVGLLEMCTLAWSKKKEVLWGEQINI